MAADRCGADPSLILDGADRLLWRIASEITEGGRSMWSGFGLVTRTRKGADFAALVHVVRVVQLEKENG
jgi:hypothetical protein